MLAAQLSAFERPLQDCGYPVELGAGVGAAMASSGLARAIDPDRAARARSCWDRCCCARPMHQPAVSCTASRSLART